MMDEQPLSAAGWESLRGEIDYGLEVLARAHWQAVKAGTRGDDMRIAVCTAMGALRRAYGRALADDPSLELSESEAALLRSVDADGRILYRAQGQENVARRLAARGFVTLERAPRPGRIRVARLVVR